jgi:hypothetical protein
MVHGNQWATSTKISVATRILQSNINIWLQERDGHNNICFTKEEYINSSLSRNVDLFPHLNHFKLLIKNSNEQNGFQFYSTSIAIQQNKRSYTETYFTIIEIGISISLGIIPGIFFVLDFSVLHLC